MKPTLHDDSFTDKSVAQAACILCETDHGITNAISLLIRPLDIRSDESGNHPGESFVMATLTREELREMVAWLDEDWAAQVAATPDIAGTSLTPGISDAEKTILTHTLTGGKRDGKVYRNHFYTGPGSTDMPTVEQLVAKGLMIPGAAPWGEGGDRYYHCTAAGAAAVGMELPKDGKW